MKATWQECFLQSSEQAKSCNNSGETEEVICYEEQNYATLSEETNKSHNIL